MGERACIAEACHSGGVLTSVCVRIGWCQLGDNDPRTINTSGLPGKEEGKDPEFERDLQWFRNMWLSNREFIAVIERALRAEGAHWPQPGIVVNGMSPNKGMPWDIDSTRQMIGYKPQHNISSYLL